MPQIQKCAVLVISALLSVAQLMAAATVVHSPDGHLSAHFEAKNGVLLYSVSKCGELIVEESKLEIIAKAKMVMVGQSVREHDSSWEPTWGQFSTIRDHHNELTLDLTANGMPVKLLCRVFDSGLGFRFLLSESTKGKKLTFYNAYRLEEGGALYMPKGEQGVSGPLSVAKLKGLKVPTVFEYKDGSALAVIESDIYTAVGFGAMKMHYSVELGAVVCTSVATSSGADQITPWRTILVEKNLGALTVNTVVLNLAAPLALEDDSWIVPGKGLWDWRVHGYKAGEFVYGINTASCMRFIDFCSEQGIEYFTLDDHWFKSAKNGEMVVAPEVDIEKVMVYAKKKDVKVKLYYDRKKGNYGDDKLFSYYSDLGASAIKYGFMGNKADFTRAAIEAAADHEIMINFHDGPVPMAGVERTMPNMISREYCHAQQDSRRAFTPETFLKMVMVNALVGPLDMANGNFGLKSINAGERQKGPKKKNSYISTVTSEVARALVVYSGIITLPDAPEEYLKKADLFEFLKCMPATWDDSRVVNADIDQYITVARRTGDTWFVGSVNNQKARTLDVRLDFLESGKTYKVTFYQDAPDSHGVTNAEAYEIEAGMVKAGDVIKARMAVGGGHAMIIEPLK